MEEQQRDPIERRCLLRQAWTRNQRMTRNRKVIAKGFPRLAVVQKKKEQKKKEQKKEEQKKKEQVF